MSEGTDDRDLPASVTDVRASDDDRDVVVVRLREAVGRGVLGLDELEQRLEATYAARTVGELAAVTADLPRPRPATPPQGERRPSALDDDGFRHHLTVYVLTIGMFIGIWLLGGAGHFWPFYPAAGWGIGLGAHWQAVQPRRGHPDQDEDDHDGEGPRAVDRGPLGIDPGRLGDEIRGLVRDNLHDARDSVMDPAREAKLRARQARRDARHGQTPPTPPRVPPAPRRADAGATPRPEDPTTRFVVATFFDIAGSTQLNEALGDAQWASVRSAFRTTVAKCISDAGGWEANTAGDGVLARFDDPAAAARGAVAVMRTLRRQRAESGFAPSVRVGIHSGDAVDEGTDIIGTVVNLAARVTGAAAVDEILVTEHVADHLGDSIDAVDRGLHHLKGVARPRHLLALDWA